ncbi:MAG: hypothetical protein RIR10_2193, partial [Planctomycetota bacterium]
NRDLILHSKITRRPGSALVERVSGLFEAELRQCNSALGWALQRRSKGRASLEGFLRGIRQKWESSPVSTNPARGVGFRQVDRITESALVSSAATSCAVSRKDLAQPSYLKSDVADRA